MAEAIAPESESPPHVVKKATKKLPEICLSKRKKTILETNRLTHIVLKAISYICSIDIFFLMNTWSSPVNLYKKKRKISSAGISTTNSISFCKSPRYS